MSRTKQGVLKSWHALKGYGTVVISRHEAYFLHTTSVVEGPENPVLGSIVYFDAAPAFRNGKLLQAVNAVIVEPVAGGAL
jgi:hypothetical protein